MATGVDGDNLIRFAHPFCLHKRVLFTLGSPISRRRAEAFLLRVFQKRHSVGVCGVLTTAVDDCYVLCLPMNNIFQPTLSFAHVRSAVVLFHTAT